MMPRSLLFIFCWVLSQSTTAQTVTGSWYGRADVVVSGSNSNYLTEFILKQKSDEVEGLFGYYFKDTYQSFFVRGTYDKKTRQVSLKNLPLLFYASPTRSGLECPMHFQGTLIVSKMKSTLKGLFYTDEKYKYTCPQLTVTMTMDTSERNTDSSLRNTVAMKKFWQPSGEDVIVSNNLSSNNSLQQSSAGTAATQRMAVTQDNSKLMEDFGKRKHIYEKDIVVYDDSILVSFYDNGDIDDDTISVFLNRKPILIRRGLTARALNIYIGLDSTTSVHELSMFADNLGKFPPNTALMVISDRQRRYELYLSASLKQNATIRLRRPR